METRVDILSKYLGYFQDEDNQYWRLIENEMGNDLLQLGYVMDSFECYRNAGLPEELLSSMATFEQIRKAFDQSNYETISSSLFSMWRYLTHWFDSDPRKYYSFCIAALERLITLEESAISKIDEGCGCIV